MKMKPKIGDLVVHTHGEVGIIKEVRGIDVHVRWFKPRRGYGQLINFSWLRRANVEVISRA